MTNLDITKDGHKSWFRDSRLHRINGPAIVVNGFTVHTVTGKAIVINGFTAYIVNGKAMTKYEHLFMSYASIAK